MTKVKGVGELYIFTPNMTNIVYWATKQTKDYELFKK